MVYVNVGCGFDVGEGWLNIDASPTLRFERLPVMGGLYTKNASRFPAAAHYGDIVKGPLCEEGTADGVYASHMLEHLPRDACVSALRHIHVMMKPGGVFRLVVPDLETRARAYVAAVEAGEGTPADGFMQETLLGQERAPKGLLRRLAALFGHQAHLWMWDEATLAAVLTDVGFRNIRRCDFGDAEDPMFARVEAKVRFDSDFGPELALEYRK